MVRRSAEPYDALVISTGVTNGFWRQPTVQSADDIDADLKLTHDRLAAAQSVIVVGGGAAAVSAAANIAISWPGKKVDLYFPGDRALAQHHPRAWARVRGRLEDAGVTLHPGHRAVVPDGFTGDEITTGTVQWSTGQAQASADAVLWTIGRVRPNTGWLPKELLDDDGFVALRQSYECPTTLECSRSVTSPRPIRFEARLAIERMVFSRTTSWPTSKASRCVRTSPRRGGGVR